MGFRVRCLKCFLLAWVLLDWLETGRRLRMREDEARILLAAHERDCRFLAELGVFDYSLLIGIHQW